MTHIVQGLILYLLFIISLSLHEWAHAFVAHKLGDNTPLLFGRLTLNPLAHIDLLGSVVIPLVTLLLPTGFAIVGWAKPVPIDVRNFKNENFGGVLVGLAGPGMNLLLATIAAILGATCVKFCDPNLGALFGTMMIVNIILCAFNIIPIPPLDGSYIIKFLFKIPNLMFYTFSRYGFFVILIMMNIPAFREVFMAMIFYLFNVINGTICGIFSIHPSLLFPI